MAIFEARTADNLAIRVEAENEVEALDQLEAAGVELEDGTELSIYTADEPVGAAREDPEAGALDDPEDR